MKLPVLLALLALGACRTARVAPIPDPLPPCGAWEAASGEGAFLGLEVRENDTGSLDALAFEPGVRVIAVVENSPAQAAGLGVGDVVLALDGAEPFDAESFEALLRAVEPGAPVALEVLRGDTVWELELRAEPRLAGGPAPTPVAVVDPARSRASWRTVPGGARLVASAPEGPLARAGVPLGAVVRSLDGEPVLSASQLVAALARRAPGERVTLALVDDAEAAERTVRVRLYEPRSRVTKAGVPILCHYEADPEGDAATFVLLDLWVISLFRYERTGAEREWSFLSLLRFGTGRGELAR